MTDASKLKKLELAPVITTLPTTVTTTVPTSPTKPTRILIVDDEPDIRRVLSDILEDEGYRTVLAKNAEEARAEFKKNPPGLVLLDIWMPNEDGISVLRDWADEGSLEDTPVIMISGHGTVENAVEAVKLGAYDFLEKPLSTGKLLLSVNHALENKSLRLENQQLKQVLANKPPAIVAESTSSRELLRQIQLLGPTDSWVFITGEPGTGKRFVARHIHENSPRKKEAFVELNLSTANDDNISAQLFGSETGTSSRPGSFELAKGGTLYINEILGLSAALQEKLLRAIRESHFMRVGGNELIEFDVRMIVTTSGDPVEAIEQGKFNQDLYYRLNVIPIDVPPLRQREDDLFELINAIVDEFTAANTTKKPRINAAALKALSKYSWPGNVRQLRNVIQRILLLSTNEEVREEDVAIALGKNAVNNSANTIPNYFKGDMREAKEAFERSYLRHHLQKTGGNVSALAKLVGLERTHLYRKLKSLNINPRDAKQ